MSDFKEFEKNFLKGESQLLWKWISADLETPVSAYLKLCGHKPYSFLLESVEGGATLGRYSIIGTAPDFIWTHHKGEPKEKLQALKKAIHDSVVQNVPADLPPMCAFGLFGYIGYDMIRLIEDIPDTKPDDLNLPESVLMRPSLLVIFDNVKNMICIATPVYDHAKSGNKSAKDCYEAAQVRLQTALDTLAAPLQISQAVTKLSLPLNVSSNTKEEDFKRNVETAVEYIKAGEIFQVVLSQRFSADFDLPAFELYRSLRSVNPSPFLFHLAFENFALVGSSPEILVRVRDNKVTIRPIAGTRKRGTTPAEDEALAKELLADEKECAEHLMLLDLGRNDVGRVAKTGTVKVTDKFQIERYSHVMHIVSNVEGELRDDFDIVDALFAGFPAGTVSGAPKIRAMEIIDELEVNRRASYAGGIGYFSGKTLDSCIALRTALVKDGKIYVQAGAGIVVDSNPEFEHQECRNKARGVIAAAEKAIEKFQK